MADSALSALAASSALTGTELFYSDNGASDVKVTATQIKTFAVGAGSVSITSGKTFSSSNTLTLAGTDGSTLNVGSGGTLGSAALKNTGTSGANVPLLNGANTWSGAQTFSVSATITGAAASALLVGGQISGDTNYRWASGLDSSDNPFFSFGAGNAARDVFLRRDAANALAQRNGTSAQTFNIYNTYTDASNYELFQFTWVANVAVLQSKSAGTGGLREMQIGTVGSSAVRFFTNNVNRWYLDASTGNFYAQLDNTYDIGGSGANRPRNVYASTSFALSASQFWNVNGLSVSSTNYMQFATRVVVRSPSDGVFKISNNAETGAGVLLTLPVAVASLPSAATVGVGGRAFVTDATATTFGSTVAGGGSNKVPVYSDGASWLIG